MSHFFPTRRSSVLPTGGSRGAGARRRSCVAGLRLGGRPRRDALESACVILIDSSAWIEFLRDTGSPVCEEVDRLLRSEEHTSELQSLMRNSYAVFCLQKQNTTISRRHIYK